MKKLFLFLVAGLLFSAQLAAQAPGQILQNILTQTSIDTLMKNVRELSGNVPTVIGGQPYTIVSRHKNNASNDKSAQWIREKLASYGLNSSLQSFSSTGANVIAVQPGTEFPNKKFIICAHFDAMPSGSLAPGADDNASGTAAVIEAARLFKNYSFPYTIVYALWDEEEQGLVGSAYYANQAATAGDSILGVFNMDMIAWDSNNDNIVELNTKAVANSLAQAQKMVELNTQYNIGLAVNVINPGSGASDHASFWSKNYSANLVIEQYNGDFNAYYHTVNDLITHFNQPYFLKCAKWVLLSTAYYALNMNMELAHTPQVSVSASQPLTVSSFVSTGLSIGTGTGAPRLYYRTKNYGGSFSSFTSVTGTPAESGNYNFVIPALPLGTVVQYYIAAQDSSGSVIVTLPGGGSGANPPGSTPPSQFYQFFVAEMQLAMNDSANTMNSWTKTGTWGTVTNKYVSSPSAFHDSPAGLYVSNSNTYMTTTQPILLTGSLGAELNFSAQWDIENNWDYSQVLISTNNGTNWTPLAGKYTNLASGSFQPAGQQLYDGVQSSWVNERIDLTSYSGSPIMLKFTMVTDGSQNRDGIYFDDIKIVSYSNIPVELTSFTASSDAQGVTLKWSTATETNNQGFSVERSLDQVQYIPVGFVEGSGTTTSTSSYSFTDRSISGKCWYRLKQIDLDGSIQYYGPVEAATAVITDYALDQNYPNPFNPSTTINFAIPVEGKVKLSVYDLTGTLVTTLADRDFPAGKHSIQFNAEKLASGMYLYRIEAGDFRAQKKLMLLK